MNKYIAELIGTFALVFAGTGAVIANDFTGGAVTHVGIALTFAFAILVMVYAVGDVSGAHFNPAVSTGFLMLGKMSAKDFMGYVLSQCAGALIASGIHHALHPAHKTLGTTTPAAGVTLGTAFIYELILTFFLVYVIFNVAIPEGKSAVTGLAIGGTILLDALFGGPITGGSMNPARSLGPAVISGNTQMLWLYIAAPLAGAALAVICWKTVRKA